MSARIRVGVLFGGRSCEHEISILSARNVLAALDRTRFEPVLIGVDRAGRWLLQKEAFLLQSGDDPRRVGLQAVAPSVSLDHDDGTLVTRDGVSRVDVIFPVLHGPHGEDGCVQGLLELAGIPYVGAGVLGSAVGMDKDVMKRLLRDAGIPVAPFRTLRRHVFEQDPDAVCAMASELGFPLFTKPANLGSSVGVRRVKDPGELREALAHAFRFDEKVLAEKAIVGREIEVSVLGNRVPMASVPGEILVESGDGFYSYDAKYVDEKGARLCIPAKLGDDETQRVQELAVRTFLALECSGLARVDCFLDEKGTFLVNEINTLPGFTSVSMYPKLWEASGMTSSELVARLIELALERHAERARNQHRVA